MHCPKIFLTLALYFWKALCANTEIILKQIFSKIVVLNAMCPFKHRLTQMLNLFLVAIKDHHFIGFCTAKSYAGMYDIKFIQINKESVIRRKGKSIIYMLSLAFCVKVLGPGSYHLQSFGCINKTCRHLLWLHTMIILMRLYFMKNVGLILLITDIA